MTKTCIECGKTFESKRKDAKFCPGSKCRMNHLRKIAEKGKLSVTNEDVTDNSVTDKAKLVTDNVTDNIADKKQDKVRKRLIELFAEEGKTEEQIGEIMKHQDDYYSMHGFYFVPVRFSEMV